MEPAMALQGIDDSDAPDWMVLSELHIPLRLRPQKSSVGLQRSCDHV
jgi:hypothetical protein